MAGADQPIHLNNPNNGVIFNSRRSPEGISSVTLQSMIRYYFEKYSNLKSKKGAHTIRHSIATLLADISGQPIVVQQFLKHSKVNVSMNYVHLSQERRNKLPSPLKLMNAEIRHKSKSSIQTKLLTDGTQSTAMVPIDESSIEQVEAVPDLSEDMFRQIPEGKTVQTRLYFDDLTLLRRLFVNTARHADIQDPIPGKLSRLWNRMLRKT